MSSSPENLTIKIDGAGIERRINELSLISEAPAPVVTRVDVGKFHVTYPTTVYDEIPVGAPGYVGEHTVNLRFSSAPPRFKSSTLYVVVCGTSGNVVTVTVTSGGSAVDVASLTVDVLSF